MSLCPASTRSLSPSSCMWTGWKQQETTSVCPPSQQRAPAHTCFTCPTSWRRLCSRWGQIKNKKTNYKIKWICCCWCCWCFWLRPLSLSLSSADGRCPSVPAPLPPQRPLHGLRRPQAVHWALWTLAGFLRLVQTSLTASAETVALSSTLTKQTQTHWAETCSSTSSRWLSHFSSSATVRSTC